MYVIADFIYIGLHELQGAKTENYKMKNYYPQRDSNPILSAYEVKTLSIALLDEISIEGLNVERVLLECAIDSYMYHVVVVVKCFIVYYILLTLYSQ